MRTRRRAEKTVYILGAGFSAPAGGLNQAHLLKHIFELDDNLPKVRAYKRALKGFLVGTLHAAPDRLHEVALEDIYTPIDRCLADRMSLRTQTSTDLHRLRAQLEYLISLAIDRGFRSTRAGSSDYADDFAAHLVKQAAIRAEKAKTGSNATKAKDWDPFSIISLNWDILIDNALYDALETQDRRESGDYAPIGVVDYCCYISSLELWQRRIRPGLWTLGARGYNVKLLKIHGSMNWLQCSNCQRLFVGFGEKVNIPIHINARTCRHCERHGHPALLQGSLVMPTFLKDLSNFQVKLVWQNTGVELMEATRLVFIGYSFPHADFEFRQLLTRTVHRDAKIHVVLYDAGTSEGTRQYGEECIRYRQFFSGKDITFEPGGVVAFVKKLCANGRQ
jgi:hypothetical protein